MYTAGGQEVRSFSQLRNEFADIDTFYLGTSSSVMIPPPILTADRSGGAVVGSPVRRSRSRAGMSTAATAVAAASGMMGGGGGGGADDAIGGVGGPSSAKGRQRARSKSRPRVLYAPESEIVRPSGGEYVARLYDDCCIYFYAYPFPKNIHIICGVKIRIYVHNCWLFPFKKACCYCYTCMFCE